MTIRINKVVQQIKQLNQQIEECLNQQQYTEAEEYFASYEAIAKTEAYYALKSNYYYLKNDVNAAIELLKEALEVFSFSYNIHYNLAMLYHAKQQFYESLIHFTRCIKYANEPSGKEIIKMHISDIMMIVDKKDVQNWVIEMERIDIETDARDYPLDGYRESLVRQVIQDENDDSYLVNMYRSPRIRNINRDNVFFKTELLKGAEKKYVKKKVDAPFTIPISLLQEDTSLKIKTDTDMYTFKKVLSLNQYHYLTFEDTTSIEIRSDKNIFIGNPISLKPKKKNPSLVLFVFIDGLSFGFLQKQGVGKWMPNTTNFFKKGYKNTNCYATSEWTLPSVASTYTGKYTPHHGLFSPNYPCELSKKNKLFSESFQDAGYFTAQINNNWRITPTYGYHKGFDRIVFQKYSDGFGCGEVITETIEHLEALENQNHYLWICLEDLHDAADERQYDLISQVNTKAMHKQERRLAKTSVLTKHEESKIEKYLQGIRRMDRHLGTLYNYINNRYAQDEVLIVLNSDHGQSFLDTDSFLLSETRRKVPLMMYGKGVPELESETFTENIDVMPTLLKLCGIEEEDAHIDGQVMSDFGGKERSCAFTEAWHPEQTYKASITDASHIFRFETIDEVNNNGFFDLEKVNVELLNQEHLKDEAGLFEEKVELYTKRVVEHMLRWQKS